MGDIADELYDQEIAEQCLYEKDIQYWLSRSDDDLKKETAASRSPMIMSIRRVAQLSSKQRMVLAKWLAEIGAREC